MVTVILFISYILISMLFTWKYVDFIKVKQWDIKSARILLGIFIAIIGLLLLSVRVAFLGGIEEGEKNVINLTLILGSVIILVIVILSLSVMHLVRKMKYMQVTFKIPGSKSEDGSLSEEYMTCLVDRNQVLNVEKVFNSENRVKIIKDKKESKDIELIKEK